MYPHLLLRASRLDQSIASIALPREWTACYNTLNKRYMRQIRTILSPLNNRYLSAMQSMPSMPMAKLASAAYSACTPTCSATNSLNHCRSGDRRRAWQIHHLADVAKLVKTPSPVISHYQYIGLMLQQILPLLFQRLFNKYSIHATQSAHDLYAFFLQIYRLPALLADIERITGHSHNQPVTQGARTLQNAKVANMKDVKCSEGDNSFHM